MLKEFKEFALKGNVLDMAVGVIMGGAFGKIITSLVNDVIMPPIGRILGQMNFSDLFVSLEPEKTAGILSLAKAKETGAAIIAYGSFINIIIDFTIVSLCIFLMVKFFNRFKKAQPAAAPTTKECPHCFGTVNIKATRCAHCTSSL